MIKYLKSTFKLLRLLHNNLFEMYLSRAGDFKNSRKFDSGLSCRRALFTTWAFEF